MKLKTFARLAGRGRRLAWGGALMGLLLAAGTTAIGDLSEEGKRLADERRESLSLFAGPTAVLQGNQLQCGIRNNGDVCANVFNSPTGGGGFWPTGTQNQYIFNTGLQVAGIMGADGGPWANDTVGAFFFDASGTVPSGTPLTNVFDSLDPDDAAAFEDPERSVPEDPTLFQDVLQGRPTASQQDSWVQYWDGDPARISGRQHPMGLTVTQRSLAWNYPAGNESLIYFLYNFENVTQSADFQGLNEAQFFGGANALPDGGITFNDMYAAFSTDMDVTSNATQNFSTAVLPFDLGISYHGGFSAPEFTYPADLFSAPFFTNAPGLIGVKYLRSPINPETGQEVGLTLFSATLNSAVGFPDPRSDKQLWRYLSGFVNPAQGDFPCNITPELTSSDPSQVQRSLCFLSQTADDTRFYQASGPFSMAPGDQATIVVAYIAAATVATLPDGTASGILANNSNDSANPPGEPSFHPGFPSARGCTDPGNVPGSCTEVDNTNDVKALERGAGWIEYDGPAPDSPLESPENKLDQDSVRVVPNSLLGRALVAQTIFDSRFLLGFAPEQPNFYLVPGNNSVTLIWEESATEDETDPEGGDPFFEVAGDTASALFNPNYRQFDVEGYRVWRGTSSGQLSLLAQFDYASTSFTDVTCETVRPDEDVGALTVDPMTGDTVAAGVGFTAGDICPDGFVKTSAINNDLVFNNAGAGGSPGSGVFRLADGTAAYDGEPITAIASDDAGASVPLADGGVPFVYVDEAVTNNFTYFYAVSAFDVNSAASGPHTLRSARVTKTIVPRAEAPNLVNAELEIGPITGDDGEALDTSAPDPTVDPETGIFSGPMPPTDAYTNISFAPLLTRLLPQLDLAITIDSIIVRPTNNPGGSQEFAPTATGFCDGGFDAGGGRVASSFGACWEMHFSGNVDGDEIQSMGIAYNPWWSAFGVPGSFTVPQILSFPVPWDTEALDAFGIPPGPTGFATADVTLGEGINLTAAEGAQARRFGFWHTGARWFDGNSADGATNTIADPSAYRRVGHVEDADTIFAPISHTPIDASDADPNSTDNAIQFSRQCFNRALGFLDRMADISVTWTGGTIEVRDETHHVPVSFDTRAGPTWGFLTTDANGNGVLDWHDFNYIDGAIQILRMVDGGDCDPVNGGFFDDGGTATPVELASSPSPLMPTSTNLNMNVDLEAGAALPQTGQGFGLFINGHRFIFEMGSLPADGTTWTLRSYQGNLGVGGQVADPSGYALTRDIGGGGSEAEEGLRRPALVPGLAFNYSVSESTNLDGTVDLTQVHTVPDPYLGSSLYDRAPTAKQLMFVNLPEQATIRIYTLTGVLVDVLVHEDITGGGRTQWDLRNRNNQFVASGVYFFHVMTPDGDDHVGKFTIINQAGSN